MRYTIAAVGLVAALAASPGCGPKNDATPTTEPAPELAPAPTPDPDARWVWASTLNLRAAADPGADVVGKLSINDPLTLLEAGDPMSRVRSADGREGWAGSAFLGAEALTLETAQARIAAAAEQGDRGEALSWAQRAAALAPEDPAVLRTLADHYARNGRDTEALEVERAVSWPRVIHPIVGMTVDWPYRPPADSEHALGHLGPLTEEQRAAAAISMDDTWWVLPARGPAKKARVREVTHAVINDCDGGTNLQIQLDWELEPGEPILAATRATPPASWRGALPAPTRCGEECAGEAFHEAIAPWVGDRELENLTLVWDGRRWMAQASWELPRPPNPDPEDWTYDLDVWREVARGEVSADGAVSKLEKNRMDGPNLEFVYGARDIDGDGVLDTAWTDGCSNTLVPGGEGRTGASTPDRCCGC